VPRFIFLGGKTAPSNLKSKHIVQLIYQVSLVINMNVETNKYLRILFIPNYNASKEYLVVPAADLNEQISLPGEEVSFIIHFNLIGMHNNI
jgi:starch phosphorylase